jgi:DNA-binding response OmpR family regulator
VRPVLLIVDDDAFFRRMIRATLESLPITIVEAADALEAVNLAQKHRPVIAVIDIVLGSEDGVRLCRTFKTSEAIRATHVVVVSGKDDAVTRVRALRAGADTFLPKPLSPLALWRQVESILAGVPA